MGLIWYIPKVRESKTAANVIAGIASLMVFAGVMYTIFSLRGCAIAIDEQAERSQSTKSR